MKPYICENCERRCEAELADDGYGPLEAHGVPFVHTDEQLLSTCCSSAVRDA